MMLSIEVSSKVLKLKSKTMFSWHLITKMNLLSENGLILQPQTRTV